MSELTSYRSLFVLLIISFTSSVPSSDASEQEWGTLTGQIVWPGKAPELKKIKVQEDIGVCGKCDLRDESLIVDPKTSGLANVVVYFSGEALPIHPELKKPEPFSDWKISGCRYEPHVLLLRTEQTIRLVNNDPILHNPHFWMLKNPPPGLALAPKTRGVGKPVQFCFPNAEILPCRASCDVHYWMFGYVMVSDNPYMAVTDATGRFTIPKFPAGTWTVRMWHERTGYLGTVLTDDGSVIERAGKRTITVQAGVNDLGTLTVDPNDFDQ